MANKIDNVIDNLETQLKTLVSADGTGVLKSVERRIPNPFAERNPPVLGLVISRVYREIGKIWIAEGGLFLVANKGQTTADETITELVAEIDAQIEALMNSGSAGGSIDNPIFDFWYAPNADNGPLMHVGATGSLRIRVEGPLKIET